MKSELQRSDKDTRANWSQCGAYLSPSKKTGKKNGVPDQGTPSNSHATTTSVAAPQGAEFII
jgi:hypothetical protein